MSLTLVAVAMAACGEDLNPASKRDDQPPEDPAVAECASKPPEVGESRIRRLTPLQYVNTVRDLFGDSALSVELHEDVDIIPSAIAVEKLAGAGAALAPKGLGLLQGLPECSNKDDACAAAFIERFATRAFRRPLLDEERQWLTDTNKADRAKYGFDDGITMLTQMILMSPQFLYLSNSTLPNPVTPSTLRRLDDYALASRLSYFLWNTMPDEELLEAAASGQLATEDRAGLRAQAERMLGSDRTRAMAHEFVKSWFQLDGGTIHFGLKDAPKDPTLYPNVDDELRLAMEKEIGALMEKVMFDGGSVSDLFTDTSAYVNGPLAALYGVSDGPTTPSDWRWVTLDPNQRAGLLTRAAFAAVYSSDKVQSPIRRGTFVLRRILCFDAPPPPPNVDNRPVEDLEANGGPKTIRQATTIRTQGATCQGCHSVIDPVGYAFEHYDAIGTFRDKEVVSQLPIDASGVLAKSGSTDGPVANAVEMSAALGKSEVAAECVARQWFQHAIRRDPELADQCSFTMIKAGTGESSNMRALLLAIVSSDAFVYTNSGAE